MKNIIISVVIASMTGILGWHKGNYGYLFKEIPWEERSYLVEANAFKGELLDEYESMESVFDSIIDAHSDDGIWDERLDELLENGYYNHTEKLDSLYATQL